MILAYTIIVKFYIFRNFYLFFLFMPFIANQGLFLLHIS